MTTKVLRRTEDKQGAGIVPPPAPASPAVFYRDLSDTSWLVKSKDGYFWCYCHFLDMPLSEQSPDPRYCRECHTILVAEAADLKKLGRLRQQWWLPQDTTLKPSKPLKNAVTTDVMSKDTMAENVTDNSCVVCGTIFHAKRSDARYCSSDCRVRAHRARGKQLEMAVTA